MTFNRFAYYLIPLCVAVTACTDDKNEMSTQEPAQALTPTQVPMPTQEPQKIEPGGRATGTVKTPESESAAASSSHDEILALAEKSGCLACHALDKRVVGPAWNDVAARYSDDATERPRLIASVVKGSKGKWGDAAMPAYSPQVPGETIEKLVDFILSLR